MRLTILLLVLNFFIFNTSVAQNTKKDSISIDTSFTDYDLLFNELDLFLDSILAPRSFTLFNLGITSGFFNFESKNSYNLETRNKNILSPSVSYFDRTGFGISAEASIIHDEEKITPYQYSLTASYDYIKNRKFISGLAFTHFITKENLPFYTSPLQNEMYAYFTYRNFWIKPTVGISYGWGSRNDYRIREEYITSFQLAQHGFSRININERISDFNITVALRHDFYWLEILGKQDYLRVTPQLVFVSGTQQFGFNQSTSTYATVRRTGVNILYNTENIQLDNSMYFQPVILTGALKAEYAKGKFFIQPQMLFNYYFPAQQNKFSTAYVINTGMIF